MKDPLKQFKRLRNQLMQERSNIMQRIGQIDDILNGQMPQGVLPKQKRTRKLKKMKSAKVVKGHTRKRRKRRTKAEMAATRAVEQPKMAANPANVDSPPQT